MYAFIHIHKAAGTTIKSVLRRTFGARHFDDGPLRALPWMTASDLRRVRWLYPRLRSIAGHQVRPFADLHAAAPDIRYFTFVRDPVKRTLSLFRARLADGQGKCGRPDSEAELRDSFLRMVEETANWQTRRLSNTDRAAAAIDLLRDRVEFVGLAERFDESLVMLRRWMAPDALQIAYRPLNVSDRRLERDAWAGASAERLARIRRFLEQAREDAQLLAAIRAANRQDRQLYEHVLRVTYPAQQARFGPDLPGELQRFQARQQSSPIRRIDSLTGRAYRNLVVKPLLPRLIPTGNRAA